MPTGRKGYYSITIEGPNQYKLTVSVFTVEFQHQPKPEQLSWVPPWQAIGGKTSIDFGFKIHYFGVDVTLS
jgi:hypothetical protein